MGKVITMNDKQQTIESHDDLERTSCLEDDAFENDCIDLMCQQENTLSHFVPTEQPTHVCESLGLAKVMLVQFLDFTELHFLEEEYTDITSRLRDVYARTKEHEQSLHRHKWRVFARLVGRECPSKPDLDHAYQELGREYTELYKDFFAVCVNRLSADSSVKEPFVQSVEVFLAELARKW